MSELVINEHNKDAYIKTLKLHAIINALKEQEDLLGGREKILLHYQQKNSSITVLIEAIKQYSTFFEELNYFKKDNFDQLLEDAGRTLARYGNEKIVGYFDISILPFLNWRHVVQSVRAQMINDEKIEEMCFTNFLGYQNRAIEAFVEDRIK